MRQPHCRRGHGSAPRTCLQLPRSLLTAPRLADGRAGLGEQALNRETRKLVKPLGPVSLPEGPRVEPYRALPEGPPSQCQDPGPLGNTVAIRDSSTLTASLFSPAARIIKTKQWCDMLPCLEGEGCDLLINRSGWTCTQPGGRIKTTTVRGPWLSRVCAGEGACAGLRGHPGSEGTGGSCSPCPRAEKPGPHLPL